MQHAIRAIELDSQTRKRSYEEVKTRKNFQVLRKFPRLLFAQVCFCAYHALNTLYERSKNRREVRSFSLEYTSLGDEEGLEGQER